MFTCGYSYEEVLKHSNKKYKDWVPALKLIAGQFSECNWGFSSYRCLKGKEYCFIGIRDTFTFSDLDQRNLAHEVLHCISFNLSWFVDCIKENESFCYTHTHVMKQIQEILRGKK